MRRWTHYSYSCILPTLMNTSERLAKLYQDMQIEVKGVKPDRKCAFVGTGFCADHGECTAHRQLDDQALTGGLSDSRMIEAISQLYAWAKGKGCNVLQYHRKRRS